MNVIERLEFELTYYDFVVHHVNHYTTRTPLFPLDLWKLLCILDTLAFVRQLVAANKFKSAVRNRKELTLCQILPEAKI